MYEAKKWSMSFPEGWEHEDGEDCLTFVEPGVEGAFQISQYSKLTPIEELEILQLIRSSSDGEPWSLSKCTAGDFHGYTTSYEDEDGIQWDRWWLWNDQDLLFVTYNCDPSKTSAQRLSVRNILNSLRKR